MIELSEIKIVHVEASSRCNSRCPMCSRFTADGFVQPGLTEIDLTADVFYKLFTVDFSKQLNHVYFSGVYGDPCLNKSLPEYVNYLIQNGCKSVSIDTNGGYRSTDWWSALALPGVLINFALDGVDNETLEKYRIGVKFEKAFENLKSFVKAGGQAQWNFIVFSHNEHQVETARQISENLGIQFRIKITQKFRGKKNYKVMVDGEHKDTIFPPINNDFRHPNIGDSDHVPISIFKYPNYSKFFHLNNNKINCKIQKRQEIYLSSTGLLLPCCYLATYTHDSPGTSQFVSLYDLENFNLKRLDVKTILENFKPISDKWDKTIEQGNLITCLHTCGNKINTTMYQGDSESHNNL